MICNIIGKECIKTECQQFTALETCELRRKFGEFLHRPMNMWDLSRFIRLVEELGDTYALRRQS